MASVRASDVRLTVSRLQKEIDALSKSTQDDFSLLMKVLAVGMVDTSFLNFFDTQCCEAEIKGGIEDGTQLVVWSIAAPKGKTLREAITARYHNTESLKKQESKNG